MSYISTCDQFSGEIKLSSRSGRSELRGPRPSPLRVFSSTIKKPSSLNRSKQQQPVNPVVIYLRSPKIIHVRPEEFMSLVQRLTGKGSSATTRTTTTTTTTTTNNNNNPSTSSSLSSASCHHMDAGDPNESMMIGKRSDNALFDVADDDDDPHQIMKPPAAANFNEVDNYADQLLGLSPTWLRSLACV